MLHWKSGAECEYAPIAVSGFACACVRDANGRSHRSFNKEKEYVFAYAVYWVAVGALYGWFQSEDLCVGDCFVLACLCWRVSVCVWVSP